MALLDEMFASLPEREASDLHLSTGLPIKARIGGDLEVIWDRVLSQNDIREYLRELVSDEHWAEFLEVGELDFAYGVKDVLEEAVVS